MTEAPIAGMIDRSKLAPPLSGESVKSTLTFGRVDHTVHAAKKEVIFHGFSTTPSGSEERQVGAIHTFNFNTAGMHLKKWREGREPTIFVRRGRATGSEEAYDIGLVWRSSDLKHPWNELSDALSNMALWAIDKETERLQQLAKTNAAAKTVFDRFRDIEGFEYESEGLEDSVRGAAVTMGAIFMMVPILVHDLGVAPENIAFVSSEIARNSYQTVGLLMRINPMIRQIVPFQFQKMFTNYPERAKEFLQLEESQNGSVFLNLSPKFLDHMKQFIPENVSNDAVDARVTCSASRVEVNPDLLAAEWDVADVQPFTKDLWDLGLETAQHLYRKIYPTVAPEED